MNITVKLSNEANYWGWSEEDLDNTNIEASTSKLNSSIQAEIQNLYPEASIIIDDGNYQDTKVRVEGGDSPEMVEEYVLDAVGRMYGAMDWVVSK